MATTHPEFTAQTTAQQVVDAFGKSLAGKTAVVTGGNGSLGLETVKALAYAGARVILASRSIANGLKAIEEEVKAPGLGGYVVPDANIIVKELDLNSFKSIKAFADELLKEERLDFLVFNAGVLLTELAHTVEGFEKHIGINHFGHFYLYQLLESKLQKQDFESRVVVLSSKVHGWSTIDWEDLHYKNKPYDGLAAYSQSKLVNLLFAKEVADRNRNTKVRSFSLHPGVIKTNILSEDDLAKIHAEKKIDYDKDVPQGAATTLFAVLAPELSETKNGGVYLDDSKITEPLIPLAVDADGTARKRIWELTEKQIQEVLKV